MPPWTPEQDRALLIRLMDLPKPWDIQALAKTFSEYCGEDAIKHRIRKYRVEAKNPPADAEKGGRAKTASPRKSSTTSTPKRKRARVVEEEEHSEGSV